MTAALASVQPSAPPANALPTIEAAVEDDAASIVSAAHTSVVGDATNPEVAERLAFMSLPMATKLARIDTSTLKDTARQVLEADVDRTGTR